MRSAQMGARKRILDKSDIDSFPFPNIDKLTKEQREEALRLANMLDAKGEKDWNALDRFVSGLFDLSKAEQQVVADTVTFNGPYAVVRAQAMLAVPPDEAATFVCMLEQAIQPFFKAVGQRVKAGLVPRLERWCLLGPGHRSHNSETMTATVARGEAKRVRVTRWRAQRVMADLRHPNRRFERRHHRRW